jgi:glycosyltransferase involved in cell wall biosynthesis
VPRGFIDAIHKSTVFGWCIDESRPNNHATVDVLLDDAPFGRFLCAQFRNDLRLAGVGDGYHAFEIRLPLRPGAPPIEKVSVLCDGVHLAHSPWSLQPADHAATDAPGDEAGPGAGGTDGAGAPPSTSARHPDCWAIEAHFDHDFYRRSFFGEDAPDDPVSHYLQIGWQEGRDPAPWFSTRHYLHLNPDVRNAGVNPFFHYVLQGQSESRRIERLGREADNAGLVRSHAFAVAAGPHFEAFDPTIGAGRQTRAKVLAYYLPQFHPVPVNDRSWGKGFTEWRNLPRALPRFEGHVQPRIPADLGCYDLAESDTLRRQIELARAAGLHGFCFYHYWFDGKRVLEKPMERLLADPSLDFPFCLMWANENWTRTWDGAEREIILRQSYDPGDDAAFVADIARHMADGRYIRIDSRPLFFIYRPGHIPDATNAIARWRTLFAERHDLRPLIFQAQSFGDHDPGAFGLDGAIEFPPHKILSAAPDVTHEKALFDPTFSGNVRRYQDVAAVAMSDRQPPYPLIRTVFPSWDNDARRPGRGTIVAESTPERFGAWLSWAMRQAQSHPVFGEPIVCVNAWNEWAEGAYLEPDVHFGGAYLNALSRVVHGLPMRSAAGSRLHVALVGHDALGFGAQRLLARIGGELKEVFGCAVSFVLMSADAHGGAFGSVLDDYRAIGRVHVLDGSPEQTRAVLDALREAGASLAITNTTVAGGMVDQLKRCGFTVLSLIHELPTLLKSYDLGAAASAIAAASDHVIFPAEVVRERFEAFAGPVRRRAEVLPQGLYNTAVLDVARDGQAVRAELGLPPGARIVLGVGYADLRKGIDRFVATGLSMCARSPELVFLWVGAPAGEAIQWFQPEIDASGLGDRVRILGYRADIARFFAAADLFYLSSREDPFPSVVLEALACGLPVVGHDGCGGCDALIARHGALVASADPLAAAEAIGGLLDEPARRKGARAKARRAEIAAHYRFDAYAFGLIERLSPRLASVSAIVPNYDYEAYVGERLRTVFDQTYPLREVLVLDDSSRDGSVEAIRAAAAAAGRRIALHVNARNSGSPFPQWRKGVELAQGEYVWIAEADDLAAPDLVARLVERMQAAGSALGFCDSRQIDEADRPLGDSYRPYLNQIDAGAFDDAFDMDGPTFLARYLAVKNVILNVSGVIFRREALMAAFAAVGDELDDFRVAGDWRLYVELCARGGGVSYLPDPLNVHRRHAVSVTHALKAEKHLGEIRRMHKLAKSRTMLSSERQRLQKQHLDACRKHLVG